MDYEIIEGRNAVIEILKGSRKVKKIFLAVGLKENENISKIKSIASLKKISVQAIEKDKIDKIATSFSHQGVIAYVEPYQYYSFNQFTNDLLKVNEHSIVLILDSVTDPQNFGSLIRSAESAGVEGIIIPKRRSVSLTSAVYKAAAGAVEHIKIVQVSNLVSTIEALKKIGFWIVGGTEKADANYFEFDFKGKTAIVLGSEGKGISRLVLEKCDFLVKIPMYGKISSLNVGIAGAILMFEARRQQKT
ncbi:MAG: 23S rRNA (guanosine(2251)-2'-O)-methyltransferase RlmB [Actinobacteria bacterium]|nr:23S rRNA (guanosine(2251)-2'-O)-methyltransferase RlmB [Actinomycetota bacterium]